MAAAAAKCLAVIKAASCCKSWSSSDAHSPVLIWRAPNGGSSKIEVERVLVEIRFSW